MIDLRLIGQRIVELNDQGLGNAAAFNQATREEAERAGADLGELRVGMLAWIQAHAIFTSDGGYTLRPALGKGD